MKVILIAMMSLFTFSTFAGEINVKVSGMVCSLCGQGIKKKFSKIDAVKSITVNLDSKVVNIQTKDSQDVSNEKITEVITEAGYNVANIERK